MGEFLEFYDELYEANKRIAMDEQKAIDEYRAMGEYMDFNRAPIDIICEIAGWMPPNSIYCFALVNKRNYEILMKSVNEILCSPNSFGRYYLWDIIHLAIINGPMAFIKYVEMMQNVYNGTSIDLIMRAIVYHIPNLIPKGMLSNRNLNRLWELSKVYMFMHDCKNLVHKGNQTNFHINLKLRDIILELVDYYLFDFKKIGEGFNVGQIRTLVEFNECLMPNRSSGFYNLDTTVVNENEQKYKLFANIALIYDRTDQFFHWYRTYAKSLYKNNRISKGSREKFQDMTDMYLRYGYWRFTVLELVDFVKNKLDVTKSLKKDTIEYIRSKFIFNIPNENAWMCIINSKYPIFNDDYLKLIDKETKAWSVETRSSKRQKTQ